MRKTMQEREKQLQDILTTPEGRARLQELAERYSATGGRVRPERTSVITFILVYERENRLISE
jgi:hypothetical protein